jgi:hypothetical protein
MKELCELLYIDCSKNYHYGRENYSTTGGFKITVWKEKSGGESIKLEFIVAKAEHWDIG